MKNNKEKLRCMVFANLITAEKVRRWKLGLLLMVLVSADVFSVMVV